MVVGASKFQSLLHQGVVRTPTAGPPVKSSAFQSLLHQGVVRTNDMFGSVLKKFGFNPFFIRASFERKACPPESTTTFQSLLHQGVVRTRLLSNHRMEMECFNPFFIRASFEQKRRMQQLYILCFNPFFIRASFERPDGDIKLGCRVSIPSSSGRRSNPRDFTVPEGDKFQSLLHQGVVRTRQP